MSLSRLSEECAGIDAVFVFGPVKIEPDHGACSGGHTRPGVLGGWVCSCACHRSQQKASSPVGDDRG